MPKSSRIWLSAGRSSTCFNRMRYPVCLRFGAAQPCTSSTSLLPPGIRRTLTLCKCFQARPDLSSTRCATRWIPGWVLRPRYQRRQGGAPLQLQGREPAVNPPSPQNRDQYERAVRYPWTHTRALRGAKQMVPRRNGDSHLRAGRASFHEAPRPLPAKEKS